MPPESKNAGREGQVRLSLLYQRVFFFILIRIDIDVFYCIVLDLSIFLKNLNYIYKNIKMRLNIIYLG